MSFYVYMLTTKSMKSVTYVGYTKNLKERIELHNSGKGAKFTRGRLWKLVFNQKYNSKKIAMIEEYKLKRNYKLRSKIKLNFIKNEKKNIYNFTL